jgi:ABC-type cobalamin/Fe3+-siderophores transport system ATPase subunit
MKSDHIKIEIQNLTMAYGSRVVTRGITVTVNQGSVFVIMGNSGSGKSTLLRHLIGMQRPAQGDVHYDGNPARELLVLTPPMLNLANIPRPVEEIAGNQWIQGGRRR